MIHIIVENHAHRLLQNGVVESHVIEVYSTGEFNCRDENSWFVADPVTDLNMEPSDFNYIRQQLEILHSMFPTGRTGVPKSETIEDVAQNYDVEKL